MRKGAFILFVFFLLVSCKKVENDNPILGDETVTFLIGDVPNGYDYEKGIYISGNFEEWSGGRPQFKLKKENDKYYIRVPKYKADISFKFTLGDWNNVECAPNGNPIENRKYSFSKCNDTVIIAIDNWTNKHDNNRPSTAAKNVEVFDAHFEIPQLNRQRKISVYLPPNYHTSGKSYPVLYMLDGQNVFDISTSYSGEWEVDETLNELFENKGFELIVVAIDHGGEKRVNEYSAWASDKFGIAEADAFLKFIVENLKPSIDKSYRTKTNAENTAILGSSLGGLFAHYVAFEVPETFGMSAVFSPSFWFAKGCYEFTEERSHISNSRVYYLAGGKESDDMVPHVTKMVELIKSRGFPQSNIQLKVVTEGTHSETFWRTEFKEAIKWLFEIK
jgi:alpha-glucosidase